MYIRIKLSMLSARQMLGFFARMGDLLELSARIDHHEGTENGFGTDPVNPNEIARNQRYELSACPDQRPFPLPAGQAGITERSPNL